MAESTDWAFPAELQPLAEEVRFNLKPVLDAVVSLRSEIPEDAFTASILGSERAGSGVVIRAGIHTGNSEACRNQKVE